MLLILDAQRKQNITDLFHDPFSILNSSIYDLTDALTAHFICMAAETLERDGEVSSTSPNSCVKTHQLNVHYNILQTARASSLLISAFQFDSTSFSPKPLQTKTVTVTVSVTCLEL